MKTLFFICLFLVCTLCHAQEKKDTKIIVTVTDTSSLFNRVITGLFEKGFTIVQKDRDLGLIATEERPIKNSASIKLKAQIKDSTISFFGEVANDVTISLGGVKMERTFERIYYGGMKGSDLRNAWNEMLSIAKQFGTEIKYSK